MPENSPVGPKRPNETNRDSVTGLGEELRKRWGTPPKDGPVFMSEDGWRLFDERWRKKFVVKKSEPSIITRAPTDEEMNNKVLLDSYMANRKQAFHDMIERIRQRRLKGGDK